LEFANVERRIDLKPGVPQGDGKGGAVEGALGGGG
jgi:hypothetical protein